MRDSASHSLGMVASSGPRPLSDRPRVRWQPIDRPRWLVIAGESDGSRSPASQTAADRARGSRSRERQPIGRGLATSPAPRDGTAGHIRPRWSGLAERATLGTEMDDLYRDYILEHSRRPHNFGVIDEPSASYEGSNPLCGDRITLQIGVDGDTVDAGRLHRPRLRDQPGQREPPDRRDQGQAAGRGRGVPRRRPARPARDRYQPRPPQVRDAEPRHAAARARRARRRRAGRRPMRPPPNSRPPRRPRRDDDRHDPPLQV